MDTEIVRAWVEGWAASRGAAPPVEEPWGFTVDVGLPKQVTRHVLPNADETLIRSLVKATTAPGTWLKVVTTPETISPWLTPAWAFDAPGFLMSTTLRPSAPDLPVGYQLRTWSRGDVTRVLIRDMDGAFAAHGQVASSSRTSSVVFDQIETAPDHRRQGLGRAVMHTLANAAIAAGARAGVLAATIEGQGLYTSLGWTTHAPVAGVFRTSSDAGR
ncbi:GNAT family N-acetyltransferase [Streptomyces sp. ALI-76-A]|uniref:GNAT family N-acetyltransferase n=1 Tax=Streptomyces sp. ALI-76-A TaxID=3025736 RepID=UPI00256EA904|nr:GNAT family N-acetyltransferase [Streptomyces sp. ALI-76-A]MDL5206107.1 GNAT family N-acetyltransferase [Streptomyces sp. ALI-76-A]